MWKAAAVPLGKDLAQDSSGSCKQREEGAEIWNGMGDRHYLGTEKGSIAHPGKFGFPPSWISIGVTYRYGK